MLVVSRFVRLGGFSSFSFFLFALAHFRSLPLAWWFCISALRGFSCSSVAVILLLLMKYVLRHVREKKKLQQKEWPGVVAMGSKDTPEFSTWA